MWSAIEIEGWVGARRSSAGRGAGRGPDDHRAGAGRRRRHWWTSPGSSTEWSSGHWPSPTTSARPRTRPSTSRVVEALVEAEARITAFHETRRPPGLWLSEVGPGITLGVKTTPLERIGAYVPGGRAAYPSTALMCTVPARIAGMRSICCCSPPPIHPLTLVALDIAGIGEIYRVGGAQAIAAMALGTESIAPVQKVVGPGNVYVTAAKRLLQDLVESTSPPARARSQSSPTPPRGPIVAADVSPRPNTTPTRPRSWSRPSPRWPRHQQKIEAMAARADRSAIVNKALGNCGYVIVDSLAEAAVAVDRTAPEHLSVRVADPLADARPRSRMPVQSSSARPRRRPSATTGPGPTMCSRRPAAPRPARGSTSATSPRPGRSSGSPARGSRQSADMVETIAAAEGLAAHAASVRV